MNSTAMNFNETKFSYLPFEMVEKILMYASEYTPSLRMVCSLWRDILGDRKKVLTINEIIKKGHIRLLRWAHDNMINIYIRPKYAIYKKEPNLEKAIDNYSPFQADRILQEATIAGRENICCLAKEWGAINYYFMIQLAAMHGHEHLCRLAMEWNPWLSGNSFIYEAAIYGHENICRFAMENGLTYADHFSLGAERGGYENIIQLAREFKLSRRGSI